MSNNSSSSSQTLTDQSLLVASKDQISSILGDEVVILNLKTGVYHGVDGVAAFIWQRLSQPRTFTDLCQAVMAEYDVQADQCRADAMALVNDLVTNGLIEIVDGPHP